jgi:hypothetical protein
MQHYVMLLQMFIAFFLYHLYNLNSLRTQHLRSPIFCSVGDFEHDINRNVCTFEIENDPYCTKGGSEHILTLTRC